MERKRIPLNLNEMEPETHQPPRPSNLEIYQPSMGKKSHIKPGEFPAARSTTGDGGDECNTPTRSTRNGDGKGNEGKGKRFSPPVALVMACPPRAAPGRETACSTPPPLPAPAPVLAGTGTGSARAPSRRRAGPSGLRLDLACRFSLVIRRRRGAGCWRRLRQ
jgi:hypothetical protein